MITALLQFLVSSATVFFAGKYMTRVYVKSFNNAMLVALAITFLNFLVGWLLTFFLHVATLGLFWITGLSFIISIVVNAIIIEIIDQLSINFETKGFSASLWLAVLLALANTIVFAIL